jgi:3-phosphoshikimate 1-carboxyvinyltransferase
MGATIEIAETGLEGREPAGDITVRSAGGLRAISVAGDQVTALIDELPALAVAMSSADGVSELRDAGELRVKESDRIAAMTAGLHAIGARVEELPDGWRISRGAPRDAQITTHGDHRLAIAFAVAALTGAAGEVTLDDPGCASVSYPTFWEHLAAVSA